MIINFLAETLTPFSIIERPSFRVLMGKHIALKSRTSYSRDILPSAYEGVKYKVVNAIVDAQAISVTTDFFSNFKGTLMRLAAFRSKLIHTRTASRYI